MVAPTPANAPADPLAVFGAWPVWPTVDAAGGLLLAAASLTITAVLLLRRTWRETPLAPVFVLFAAFAACCALGSGVTGVARLAAGVLACGVAGALLRCLPRAAAADRAVRDDLDRLRVLETAVAASGDGVLVTAVTDGVPRIVFANAAFEQITGYGDSEAVGLSPSVLADEDDPDVLAAVREALRGSEPVRMEVPGRRKDGTRVWAEWQVVPVPDAAGRVVYSVAVLRDTTARRRGEQALRDSEARFRGLFEQAADAIFLLDPLGRILDANRRACQILGYTREEFAGLNVADLDAGSRPVDLDLGETMTADNCYRRKDGTELPVEVRFAVIEAGGRRLKLALVRDVTRRRRAEQTLREREELLRHVITHIPCGVFWKDRASVYLGCNEQVARDHGLPSPARLVGRTDLDFCATREEAEFYRECDRKVIETGVPILNLEETQTRPGGARHTLLTSKVPLRDSSGAVVGVLGVYQDITDRKRLEEQFRQAQKMEAVGRLAGGIAHDFNNLLTVILGNAELLLNPTPDADAAQLAGDIHDAADRAASLTRQLLTFSGRRPARPEVIDLNEVVSRLGGLLGRLLGERVAVRTRLAPGPLRLRADRGQLEQVVMNLAVNARDAMMPAGGTLTIATTREPGGGPGGAGRVRLSVTDTGAGMTDEVKAKIFEPFFTTKGPDKGTGLGLAVVHGVVEQAGGRIEVESAPGVGTTFRVDLPECDTVRTPTPLPVRSPVGREAPARGGSVLLVEDEDGVRKLARFVLEGHGYAVREACDAEAALAHLADGAEVDLLVTDMVMPGMDGRDLADRVRSARPDVGVVFVSGYVPENARLAGLTGAVFLPKPFTPADLLRAAAKAILPRPARPAHQPA